MDNLDNAKHDHQKNKSDIVNLVKRMLALDKWGDVGYKKELQDLVRKDEDLVKEVARIIRERNES